MYASRVASIIVVLFGVGGVKAQSEDRSLPTQAYLDRGVTTPDQPWTSRDFEKLIAELQRLRQSTPDQLPRMDSSRSGKLFVRIISPENSTRLVAKNVELQERWTILDIAKDLQRVDKIYYDAEEGTKLNYERERFALYGAQLDCSKLTAQLLVDFVDNAGRSDPMRKFLEDELPKKRKEFAHDIETGIKAMSDAGTYGPDMRSIIAAALSRDAGLFAFAEPPRRLYLLNLLKKAADDENEQPLKTKMTELVGIAISAKLEPLPALAGADVAATGNRLRRSAPDNSLALDDYYQKGIPPLARPWTSDDLEKAADILEKMSNNKPDELPRAQSPKSGTLFARLIAPENTSTLKEKKADFAVRAAQMRSADAMVTIVNSYVNAENKTNGGFEREHVATLAALTAVDSEQSQFIIDFVQRGGRSDPRRQRVADHVNESQRAFSGNLASVIKTIGDPIWVDLASRTTLTDSLVQNIEPTLNLLTVEQRAEVADLLTDVADAEPDEKLKAKLKQLVKTAGVKRPVFPPAAAPAGRGR